MRWNINSVTIVNDNCVGNQGKRGFDRAYGVWSARWRLTGRLSSTFAPTST